MPRFQSPLGEPDVRISRIRLSDKAPHSRLLKTECVTRQIAPEYSTEFQGHPISAPALPTASPRTQAPSLHQHYPASPLLRACPPPRGAASGPRGPSVGPNRSATPRGFPCCIGLPAVNVPSPLPRRNAPVLASLTSQSIPAFPVFQAGRLAHCPFRGLLSVHSRYGPLTRRVTYMTLYTRGFSRFVASATAPVATGRSESCRVGVSPTDRPCLGTAH
jgi:hypothetical protein